ncbi:hypothetical protein [Arenicella xantha]|nr:hypothetical protein [Arenicella xantha]
MSILLFIVQLGLSNRLAAIEIDQLSHCAPTATSDSSVAVLDSSHTDMQAWSHVGAYLTGDGSLAPLQKRVGLIGPDKVPGAQCRDCWPFRGALVVKLSDWTQQHVNGLEVKNFSEPVVFGDLKGVEIELKFHSQRSQILDQSELTVRYRQQVSPGALSLVDHGNANLGITLFGGRPRSDSAATLNAEIIIGQDASLVADRWLRVFIPIDEFATYLEQDYQRQPAQLLSNHEQPVLGLRLVAETESGQQLRNVLGDAWHAALPETFKVLDMSLCRIRLLKH